MSELSHQSHGNSPANNDSPERVVGAGREHGATAPVRCLLYALCSDIAASPFDVEPAVAGEAFSLADLELPFSMEDSQRARMDQSLSDWRNTDKDILKREYSSLFEVGSDGPPIPMREDLHRNQPAGLREDIVRFYEFFGYGLQDKFAWAPDHLSVELEFMHFLVYREAESSAADALSFQLAQHDFAERHLVNWVPELAEKTNRHQSDALYGKLLSAVSELLVKDFEWQRSTIV